MTKIIIFNRLNKYNIINTKNIDKNNFYKKCNFKKNNNFNILYEWYINSDKYQLWGKQIGQPYLLNNFNLNNLNNFKINSNIKIYGSFLISRLDNEKYIDIDESILFKLNYQENINETNNAEPNNDKENISNTNSNNDIIYYTSSELQEEEYYDISGSN